MIAGIFLLDVYYSFNIAFRIRKIAKRMKKKYVTFVKFKDAGDLFKDMKKRIEKSIIGKLPHKYISKIRRKHE